MAGRANLVSEGRKVLARYLRTTFGRYDTTSIAEQRVLDHDSSRELASLINRDEWEPLA